MNGTNLTKEQQIEAINETMDKFLEIHDNRVIFETLSDVVHLLDLLDLKSAQKSEFYTPTPKGRIQKETREKTISLIRKYLLNEMANRVKQINQSEEDDIWKDSTKKRTDN